MIRDVEGGERHLAVMGERYSVACGRFAIEQNVGEKVTSESRLIHHFTLNRTKVMETRRETTQQWKTTVILSTTLKVLNQKLI